MKKLLLATLLATSFTVQASAWVYSSNTDEFTDETIKTAYSVSHNGKAMAVARCKDGEVDFLVNFNKYLNNEDVVVKYRVDKSKPVELYWAVSTGGKAVFAKSYFIDQLIPSLMNGSKLLISAENYRGTQYTAKFSLKGSSFALEKVMNCK